MNIETLRKRFLQRPDIGDMRQQPKLDLTIVGTDQLHALRRHKRRADLAPLVRADRNVLQIRIVRRQPPGRRRRHGIRSVDAPRMRIDVSRQRVRVRAFQLGHLPPVDDLARQIVSLDRQLFQRIRVCRPLPGLGFLAARQTELAEQNIAKLLGRTQIEPLARQPVDRLLQPRHPLRKAMRQPRQHLAIDQHPRLFHIGKHRHQRPFQRFINRGQPLCR